MAAKGMEFPWRSTSATISTNLDVIWGMSANMDDSPTTFRPKGEVEILPGIPSKANDRAGFGGQTGATLAVFGLLSAPTS